MKQTMWRATFKTQANMPSHDRRRWQGFDLEVILPAADPSDARVKVFEVARQYISNPYLNVLEKVELPVWGRLARQGPWHTIGHGTGATGCGKHLRGRIETVRSSDPPTWGTACRTCVRAVKELH